MRMIKKIFLGSFIAICFLIGAFTFLLCTTNGLHIVINGIVRCVPGLEVDSVSGGWRNLTIKRINYKKPGVEAAIKKFTLSLDLSRLICRSLYINALTVHDATLVIKTQGLVHSTISKKTRAPLTYLRTTCPIILRFLALDNIKISIDDTAISVAELHTGLEWEKWKLTIQKTKMNSLIITLPKTTKKLQPKIVQTVVELAKKINKQANQIVLMPPKSAIYKLLERFKKILSKSSLTNLPDIFFPMDIIVKEIHGTHLQLVSDTNILINRLLLQIRVKDQCIQLDRFGIELPEGSLSMHGKATLTGTWPINMVVHHTLNIAMMKGECMTLSFIGGLRKSLKVVFNSSGLFSANLEAQINLGKPDLPFFIKLQSKKMQWPLNGKIQYQATNFKLYFNGRLNDYKLSTEVNVSGYHLPLARLILHGHGSTNQFKLEKLSVSCLQNNANLTAQINWKHKLSWSSQLMLSHFSRSTKSLECLPQLDGSIATKGYWSHGNWRVSVPFLNLNGDIKKNKILVRGKFSGNSNGEWDIPTISLFFGKNQLTLVGRIDNKAYNLNANIDAPHLDGTLSGLSGFLKGQLKLRGRLESPRILMRLNGSYLKWHSLFIKQVKIDADLNSDKNKQGYLNVVLEKLRQNRLKTKLLTLCSTGNKDTHQIQLDIDSQALHGKFLLQGKLDEKHKSWYGSLNNIHLNTPISAWCLTKVITLDYLHDENKINTSQYCRKHKNTKVCTQKTIEANENSKVHFTFKYSNLERISSLLDLKTVLSNIFLGYPDIDWKSNRTFPIAKVSIVGHNLKVIQNIKNNALPIDFDLCRVSAELSSSYMKVDWLFKLKNNGTFNGHFQVTNPRVQNNISGNIKISNLSLGILNPLSLQVEKFEGLLNANLHLGRTVQEPEVFGQLTLEKINIRGSWMPFDMVNSFLSIKFNGLTSKLEGLIKTKCGQMKLLGNASWYSLDNWHARITAKGNNFRIIIPSIIHFDVSPDLVLEASPKGISFQNLIYIPWARIKILELPESIVAISSDELMINSKLKPIQLKAASIPIHSNLIVRIGDDVMLDAFGLKSRLVGSLKVVTKNNNLGIHGAVTILSGKIHSYGQDLIVRKGKLIFSGPLDRSMICIEAIRNPQSTADNIIVGIHITGPIQSPSLEIFSEPEQLKQEALSYLLHGQKLNSISADSTVMTSILINVVVRKSVQLIEKIGAVLGLHNLILDTQGVGVSSKIVVSGDIFENLKVKYGVGIFDTIATLTFRYRLMPKFYIEAISGFNQALYFLYKFEF